METSEERERSASVGGEETPAEDHRLRQPLLGGKGSGLHKMAHDL